MYTLTSESLVVSILDPIADQERFGIRYCTGGYIFQIEDQRHGALLSGPTYPDSFNWFDGQGIPDAFNLSPLHDPALPSFTALIIGVGVCDLQAKEVTTFCQWDVKQAGSTTITMQTAQAFGPFGLDLERTVELRQRSVRSATRLRNTGSQAIPLRWFPHPFFPQPQTDELCRLNIPFHMPVNSGYTLAPSGFISRLNWPWTDRRGYFHALDHAAQTNVLVLQKHPLLGLVAATCSYVPSYFPIWGNPQTFSWEPFLERTVGIGQELNWWIDYDF